MRSALGCLLLSAALAHAQAPSKKSAPAAAPSSYRDLKFAPLRPVRVPELAAFTLANGLKVYLLERRELPLVSGFALIRTGHLFDPPAKTGLAEMTATVLRTGGTKALTGDQIDEKLENVTASVESRAEESDWKISVSALRGNADEALQVFRDLLVEPEFRQDKIELLKTQLCNQITRRNEDLGAVAKREFSALLRGRTTPYGARLEYESLNHIGRRDLIEFYRRYVFPANVMLALYGDFSVPEMRARLEKLFGSWEARQAPVPPFPELRNPPQPGVYLAQESNAARTVLQIGHLGGVLRDKNEPALEVLAYILGGDVSSRLGQRAGAHLNPPGSINTTWDAGFEQPGLFQISMSVNTLNTTEVVQIVREEIEKIRTAPVTDLEFIAAKDTVTHSFAFSFDTTGKILLRVIRNLYYGYPADFISQYQKDMAAVTKQDILRVAKQYLKPEQLIVVAVGNSADFGKPLNNTGLPVRNIDLTIPALKLDAARADAASLRRGRELLQRLQQALSGTEQLAAIRDSTAVTELDVATGGGLVRAKQTTRWIAPSHLQQENVFPFGRLTVYFDGAEGWLANSQSSRPLTGAVLKQAQEQAFHTLIPLCLSDRDALRTVNLVEEGQLEISNQQGQRVRLTVEEKTGLPLKISYQMTQPTGPPVFTEETFGDWRETGGIRLPYRIAIQQGGRAATEVRVLDWLLNSGLNPEVIGKRP